VSCQSIAGEVPLDFMLAVMRDPDADYKRRDAMAIAAAPYLHPKLSSVEAKMSPIAPEPSAQKIEVVFVVSDADHARDESFTRQHSSPSQWRPLEARTVAQDAIRSLGARHSHPASTRSRARPSTSSSTG
jgi:hypothetical protein